MCKALQLKIASLSLVLWILSSETRLLLGASKALSASVESIVLISNVLLLSTSWTGMLRFFLLLIKGILMMQSAAQINDITLNIRGTLSGIGQSGGKILPPDTSKLGSSLSGFTIATAINENIKEPDPKPATMIPLTNPFLFGKYSHPAIIGHIYEGPIPRPNQNPYKNVNNHKLLVKDEKNTHVMAIDAPNMHHSHGGYFFIANGAIGVNKAEATIDIGNMILVSSSEMSS